MIESNETNFNHDPEMDSLIERTLLRDAEITRARFASVPNAELTAKLALSTASRGLLGSLSAKFALYAGAALVVGGAIYLIPSLTDQPSAPVKSSVPMVNQPSALPAPTVPLQNNDQIVTSTHSSKAITKAVEPSVAPSTKPPLQIDEGDGKPEKKITDPNYTPR